MPFIQKNCPRCGNNLRKSLDSDKVNCFFCEGYLFLDIEKRPWIEDEIARPYFKNGRELHGYKPKEFIDYDSSLAVDDFIYLNSWEYRDRLNRKDFAQQGYYRHFFSNYLRQIILKRDEYACADCNSHLNLHVHHVIPVSHDPSLEFDFSNLITLCRDCHSKRHGYEIPFFEDYDATL